MKALENKKAICIFVLPAILVYTCIVAAISAVYALPNRLYSSTNPSSFQ